MKKIIVLSAIIAAFSSNNASGMLVRYIAKSPIKQLIPKHQLIPQWRYNINALPPKNIFNIDINSAPKNEVSCHLEDINYRNETIADLLKKQIENLLAIERKLQQQRDILINYTFYSIPLDVAELKKIEKQLKYLFRKDLKTSTTIQNEIDYLDIKPHGPHGHADE